MILLAEIDDHLSACDRLFVGLSPVSSVLSGAVFLGGGVGIAAVGNNVLRRKRGRREDSVSSANHDSSSSNTTVRITFTPLTGRGGGGGVGVGPTVDALLMRARRANTG